MTIMKWGISGQGYKQLTRFSRFLLFKPADFLLFEENHQNRISRAGEKISQTISLFFSKMIA